MSDDGQMSLFGKTVDFAEPPNPKIDTVRESLSAWRDRSFGKYIVYVDESGDHGMQSIDAQYPLFVLAFCVFHKGHYGEKVVPALES